MLQPRRAPALLLLLALATAQCRSSEMAHSGHHRDSALLPTRRMQEQQSTQQLTQQDQQSSQLQPQQEQQAQQPCPVKVSVVMLNWQRPQNVRKIANTYATYDCVEEVIIWMCHPDTRFDMHNPKVRIIDDVAANDKDGLSTRFRACLMAKQPWVLIQDDDHYLKEAGLLKLITKKQQNPGRILGTFGRDWPAGQPPQYIRHPVFPGPARIMLTILMLTDQEACKAFWKHAPLVQEHVRNNSKPLWNGEDIFLSLASFKETGEVPHVVGRVAKVFMPQHGTGVHFLGKGAGFSGHDDYRDRFLKYAVQALQIDYGNKQYGRHVKKRAQRMQGVAKRRSLIEQRQAQETEEKGHGQMAQSEGRGRATEEEGERRSLGEEHRKVQGQEDVGTVSSTVF